MVSPLEFCELGVALLLPKLRGARMPLSRFRVAVRCFAVSVSPLAHDRSVFEATPSPLSSAWFGVVSLCLKR